MRTEQRLRWLRIAYIEWIEAEEKWPSEPTAIVSNSAMNLIYCMEMPKKSDVIFFR